MNKQEAYKIVLKDLITTCPMFYGIYDAEHGGEDFMCGISTVMEVIAYKVSEEVGDEFTNAFFANMAMKESLAEALKNF